MRNKIFSGVSHDAICCARNVAIVELDSTSATVACNVARKVAQCVPAFRIYYIVLYTILYGYRTSFHSSVHGRVYIALLNSDPSYFFSF